MENKKLYVRDAVKNVTTARAAENAAGVVTAYETRYVWQKAVAGLLVNDDDENVTFKKFAGVVSACFEDKPTLADKYAAVGLLVDKAVDDAGVVSYSYAAEFDGVSFGNAYALTVAAAARKAYKNAAGDKTAAARKACADWLTARGLTGATLKRDAFKAAGKTDDAGKADDTTPAGDNTTPADDAEKAAAVVESCRKAADDMREKVFAEIARLATSDKAADADVVDMLIRAVRLTYVNADGYAGDVDVDKYFTRRADAARAAVAAAADADKAETAARNAEIEASHKKRKLDAAETARIDAARAAQDTEDAPATEDAKKAYNKAVKAENAARKAYDKAAEKAAELRTAAGVAADKAARLADAAA